MKIVYPSPESIQLIKTLDEIPQCHIMNAFNRYIRCKSVRTQISSTYEFGKLQVCSGKWEDLKFAAGLKMMEKSEQLHMCKEYYKLQLDNGNGILKKKL